MYPLRSRGLGQKFGQRSEGPDKLEGFRKMMSMGDMIRRRPQDMMFRASDREREAPQGLFGRFSQGPAGAPGIGAPRFGFDRLAEIGQRLRGMVR